MPLKKPITGVVPVPEKGEWKKRIDRFIKEHPLAFDYELEKGYMAPILVCEDGFEDLANQLRNMGAVPFPLGDTRDFSIKVSNVGNAPSFSAYIELFEGPYNPAPLREFRLCDYKVGTINPGQTVTVTLSWTRQLETGTIAAVCFDLFLDPRGIDTIEVIIPHPNHVSAHHFDQYMPYMLQTP
jgi:hypothetical protein